MYYSIYSSGMRTDAANETRVKYMYESGQTDPHVGQNSDGKSCTDNHLKDCFSYCGDNVCDLHMSQMAFVEAD